MWAHAWAGVRPRAPLHQSFLGEAQLRAGGHTPLPPPPSNPQLLSGPVRTHPHPGTQLSVPPTTPPAPALPPVRLSSRLSHLLLVTNPCGLPGMKPSAPRVISCLKGSFQPQTSPGPRSPEKGPADPGFLEGQTSAGPSPGAGGASWGSGPTEPSRASSINKTSSLLVGHS